MKKIGRLFAYIKETIFFELHELSESFHQLSLLGKLQVGLLLLNVVLTIILLNVGASVVGATDDGGDAGWTPPQPETTTSTTITPPTNPFTNSTGIPSTTTTTSPSPQMSKVDYTTLAISIEFAVFSLFGILYTVSVESMFAFWGLVIVEVELATFVTGAAAIGVLREVWLKWFIVALNWACIAAFLLLQLVVRKSWGWHAYKQVGGGAESVQLYRRYQMLCAAIIGDAFHTIFFITCEEIIIKNSSATQHWLVYGFCVPAVLLTFPLVIAVRKGYRVASALIYIQYLAGMGNFLYFTTMNTISVFEHDEDNLDVETRNHFNTRNQQLLVMLAEWCIVLARFVLLVLALPVISSPNISSIFGKGAFSGLLLTAATLTEGASPYDENLLLNEASGGTDCHTHARRRLLVLIDSKRDFAISSGGSEFGPAPPAGQDEDGTSSGGVRGTSPRPAEPFSTHNRRNSEAHASSPYTTTRSSQLAHRRDSMAAGSPSAAMFGSFASGSGMRNSVRVGGGSFAGGRNSIAVIDASKRSQSLIGGQQPHHTATGGGRGSSILSGNGGNSQHHNGGLVVGDSSYYSPRPNPSTISNPPPSGGGGGRDTSSSSNSGIHTTNHHHNNNHPYSSTASFNEDDNCRMSYYSQSKLSDGGGGSME